MSVRDDVTGSFHRCRVDDKFFDTFYDSFLSKSPEIAKKFVRTNFRVQKLMLRESLLEMLCLEQGMKGSEQEIARLGRRHRELEVTDDMYEMWLDSLCESVRRHDPQYTPELEQNWRDAMRRGLELMKNPDQVL